MCKSILLMIIVCFQLIYSKLIITDFDYQYTKDGVIIRCLYDNGQSEYNDKIQFFFNKILIYSFDPKDAKPIINNQIDGAQLDVSSID